MKGNFQTIIIITFIALAVFGVLVFSGAIKIGSDNQSGALGTVTLWGTVKVDVIASALDDFNRVNKTFIVKYVQKYPETFDQDLLEALASGQGPDMFFLPDNLVFNYKNKIYPIPYQSLPVATFENSFASAGEVFLTSKGVLAFPIAIDPMVMYYNRSILDANSVVYPPVYWDEFINLVPILTKKDENKKIIKSGVAMGQFSNIDHSKDIISILFMQAGNPIITEKNGYFVSTLNETGKYDLGSILKFYTDFSNPLKDVYSWNKAMPNSSDVFSADNLAFYFGYASELQTLINKNPNLNFLPAQMPQIKNASSKLTSARVTGIAISAFSKNLNTAFTAAGLLSSSDFASKFANALGVAPARRDLLAIKQTDAYLPTFYSSALYSRSWLDPSSNDTDNIFRGMVEGVLSNNMTVENAVRDASAKLSLLLAR
ncbi:MAG: extracellular solute-binding protein [Candidatus Paceibacterota bacterium]|jgi:ABC-type glycerol-3-phosphate transport system substrate-binding protein